MVIPIKYFPASWTNFWSIATFPIWGILPKGMEKITRMITVFLGFTITRNFKRLSTAFANESFCKHNVFLMERPFQQVGVGV
jgi:hypothetical protein